MRSWERRSSVIFRWIKISSSSIIVYWLTKSISTSILRMIHPQKLCKVILINNWWSRLMDMDSLSSTRWHELIHALWLYTSTKKSCGNKVDDSLIYHRHWKSSTGFRIMFQISKTPLLLSKAQWSKTKNVNDVFILMNLMMLRWNTMKDKMNGHICNKSGLSLIEPEKFGLWVLIKKKKRKIKRH